MRRKGALIAGVVIAWCGVAAVAAAPARPVKPAAASGAKKPAVPAPAPTDVETNRAGMEFFEREIRPLLAKECYTCHADKHQQGGLRLDSREGLLKGGARGSSLLPGEPKRSLLVKAVLHDGLVMPPGRKLTPKQIASLEQWVRMGAPWPNTGKTAGGLQTWEMVLKTRRDWWSLKPVARVKVPAVKDTKWSAQAVDRFILAGLEQKGLKPAPRADRRTLIRRVYLSLTGLPPSVEEVEAYVNDKDPKAYEKLVDRMLASPHFGERWARHWMDVVRFNETHGYEWNHEIRDVWRYRDYVIRAFNQDVPYDDFVREHIAGDLIPNPRTNPEQQIANESRAGTAFYRFGEVGHDVFKEIGLDHLDNQIDTLSKAFQATTLSCARCHDHKLDAISTKDYYAMLGILASSRQVIHTLDDRTVNAQPKQKLKALKEQIRQETARLWQGQAAQAGRYLLAAQAARDKAPNAAELAQGLDAGLLKSWTTALEKKGAGLEDPLTPWQTAADAARSKADVAAAWTQLSTRYATESAQRAEFNTKNFVPWGDFSKGMPATWRGDGLAVHDGVAAAGEFAVSSEGDQAVSGVFPAGFYSHVLSEKLNASLHSPYVPEKKFVSVEVMGDRNAAARFVPDFRLLQDGGSLKQPALEWKRFRKDEREERGYIELCTKLDNIRYPGWGGGDKGDAFKDPRSFFGVTRAYMHDVGESPKDDLKRVLPMVGAPASTLDAVAERYAGVLGGIIAAWGQGKSTDEDARLIDWMVQKGLVANSVKASPRLSELVTQYRKTDEEIKPARVVAGLADLDGFDHAVYLRGDVTSLGDVVRRRYMEVLSSEDMSTPTGSGRLQLANEIASPTNPLTGRVMVNRVWHYLYGTGIVRTPDDFGHMGEVPSNPALLDYLAGRFVATTSAGGQNWSMKKLIRSLVLSETFQMSSVAAPATAQIDPENRLLHHFPARRLEAEAIRDTILAVSGRLDRTLYGPSIQPFRSEPMPERRLFPGPLDGNGRRSIYTKVTLMQGPKFLEVFNFPDPKVAVGRRDVTNVPAQALTLLNDPFVIGQADLWAAKLLETTDSSVAGRVERMFLTSLGRRPTRSEAKRFEQLVTELASLQQLPAGEVLSNRGLWKDVAHSVFNMKEFIYVR